MPSGSATLKQTLDTYTILCYSPFLSFVPLLPLSFVLFFPSFSGDVRDELHCMRYGACVVFEDGTTFTAFQRKALEYGCSLDPVAMVRSVVEWRWGYMGDWWVGVLH